ncbi:XRE family transcriptional regulator [Clostridia bacterium]|nr:XRE family transcriptional regulator [Clostridia bacterium]
MAGRSSSVYVRVEPEIKAQAECVLDQLGLPMSNAIALFLRQVILQQGMPFSVVLPRKKPLVFEDLTEAQFNTEIEKGLDDYRQGRIMPAEEVTKRLFKELNL